ncbi:hypothetical protein [Cellulomonas sp. URHB0016]
MSLVDVDGLPTMIAQAKLIEAIAGSVVSFVEPGWAMIEYHRSMLSPVSYGYMRVTYSGRTIQTRMPWDAYDIAKSCAT